MKKAALAILATSRQHAHANEAQRKASRSVAQLAAEAAEPLSALKLPYKSHGERIPDSYLLGMNAFEQTLAILSRPPGQRQETDMADITTWLRHRSDVFKRLRNDQLFGVLKNCKYLKPKRDEIIVRQGDVGDCCYINLSGKVSIYIDIALNQPEDEGGEGDPAKEQDTPVVINVGDIYPKRDVLGTFVVSLGAGAPFGEMAMLSADSTRKAYVIADEDMHVIEINRDLFNLTLRVCIEEDYRDKRTFINSCPFFSNWSPDYKEQLAMALEREVYYYDQHIVRQGEPVEALYFLISGEAQIFLNPVAHEQYFRRQIIEGRDTADVVRNKVRQLKVLLAHKYHKKDVLKSLDEEDDLLSFDAFVEDTVTKEQQLFRPGTRSRAIASANANANANANVNGASEKKRSITLCVQRPIGIVGDLEYFLQLDKYAHSVLCTERTVVLKLESRQYERLTKRNPSTARLMMEVLTDKLRSRIDGSQTVCREVPLMKYALLKSYALCQNYEYEQVKMQRLASMPPPRLIRVNGVMKHSDGQEETKVVRSIKRDYERKALISPVDRKDVTIPLEYLRMRFGRPFSSLIGLNRPISAAAGDSQSQSQSQSPFASSRMLHRSQTARPGLSSSTGRPTHGHEGRMRMRMRRTNSLEQVQLALQVQEPLGSVNFNATPVDLNALKRNNCFLLFRNKGIFSLG